MFHFRLALIVTAAAIVVVAPPVTSFTAVATSSSKWSPLKPFAVFSTGFHNKGITRHFAASLKADTTEASPPSGSTPSSAIPPPCQFDDPVDLSVVVSWVEDIMSQEWGELESDVRPLFYELGMGYTQVAVCVSEEQEAIYVTFRGTDIMEVPDIWSNLDIFWDTYGPKKEENNNNNNNSAEEVAIDIPGKVQRGWNRKVFNPKLYLPLSEKILQTKKEYPHYQVVIAGHSLGAALSILFGAYVAKYVVHDHPIENRVQVINLGSPRVGDEQFYHSLEQISNLSIWRMVFEDDIVPRYPPMWLGYRHVGHMLHWEGEDSKRSNRSDQKGKTQQGIVKAYHQQLESCMDSQCYAGIQPSEWNILSGRIDHHKHSNYKCILDQAKDDPEKYWPSGFEMK